MSRCDEIKDIGLNVGKHTAVVEVNGFAGSPGIDCTKHGRQPVVFVAEISMQSGVDIWLCDICSVEVRSAMFDLKAKDLNDQPGITVQPMHFEPKEPD